PERQIVTIGADLSAGRPWTGPAWIAWSGMLTASAMWPPSNSPGVRTSRRNAPSLTNLTTSVGSITSDAEGAGGGDAAPGSAGNSSGRCFRSEPVYLKTLSGNITTQIAPGSSGTSLNAPASAMPELGPAMMLSSWLSRLHIQYASSLPTSWTPSYSLGRKKSVSLSAFRLRTPGMSWPSLGWTPSTLILLFLDFRKRPPPVMVPQVPRPATKWVIFPSVWRQISGPVVRKWASGLAGFLYWLSWCQPGCLPISAAFCIAPSGAPGSGQRSSASSTSFAPNVRSAARFSAGIARDSVAVNLSFFAFEII